MLLAVGEGLLLLLEIETLVLKVLGEMKESLEVRSL
jgi:hypothetical protein